MNESRKVFSVKAFLDSEGNRDGDGDLNVHTRFAMQAGWPQKCDGKTEEEMEQMYYGTHHAWMVPVEDYRPYIAVEDIKAEHFREESTLWQKIVKFLSFQ